MRVEIRNDVVLIDGYVNAVERDSKVLQDSKGAFVEKVKAGVFQRALDRAKKANDVVRVLLNHKYERELTTTQETTTILAEDAIGLRCKCEIRDAEVVQKAKEGKLVGWSFGFIPIKEEWEDGVMRKRELRELELKEVSILDNTKTPAYDGTSIETRTDGDLIEFRAFDDEIELIDSTTIPKEDNHEFENRYMATRIGY